MCVGRFVFKGGRITAPMPVVERAVPVGVFFRRPERFGVTRTKGATLNCAALFLLGVFKR
ncbi:hypothetical protein HK27_08735 [Acetobacter orientalis]|nr:hypothetical protein HK27_08735 [Acetobacter orientalis]